MIHCCHLLFNKGYWNQLLTPCFCRLGGLFIELCARLSGFHACQTLGWRTLTGGRIIAMEWMLAPYSRKPVAPHMFRTSGSSVSLPSACFCCQLFPVHTALLRSQILILHWSNEPCEKTAWPGRIMTGYLAAWVSFWVLFSFLRASRASECSGKETLLRPLPSVLPQLTDCLMECTEMTYARKAQLQDKRSVRIQDSTEGKRPVGHFGGDWG